MKKIAIFQSDLNFGGIQKSLINLLNNIDYKKYEIDLYLTSKDNVFMSDLNKNVKVFYLKPLPYITRIVYFNILKCFYKSRVKKEYDIAIDFNSYSMDTALAAITTKARKKIIWVHNDIDLKLNEEPKYRTLYKFFKSKYKYFDSYVAVSNGALESFERHHCDADKEYNVIPNMIDTKEIIEKSKEENSLSVNDKKYNFCAVGRIEHQKGFDILLENIKELIKLKTDFHLYIIGDGEDKDDLMRFVRLNDLEDYVTFTGYITNPYSIMKDMDGFVLTSRYEGQGMVFLEAKCLGLDIIMPKHIEKYIDEIKGTDNILNSLIKVKKHKKKVDYLEDYNNKIIESIDNLFKIR